MTMVRPSGFLLALSLVGAAVSCTVIADIHEGTPRCVAGEIRGCYTGPEGTRSVGACKDGVQNCNVNNEYGPCLGDQQPGMETCDPSMLDEDCDGETNEDGPGCVCKPGEPAPCYAGPQQTKDVGICADGTQSCNLDGLGFGACTGDQQPLVETCDLDLSDEDCDGFTNEGGSGCAVQAIAVGGQHACALLGDGRVKCWGANAYGQLGLGETLDQGIAPGQLGQNLPAVDLGKGKVVTALAAGGQHTCALFNDGSLKCWGYNQFGQLGLGDAANRGDAPDEMGDNLPAVDLGAGKKAVAVATGNTHTCVILSDNSLRCWGRNFTVQLGIGKKAGTNVGAAPNEMGDNLPAVDLGTGKTAVAVAPGWSHTCALLNDGAVKCWGHYPEGMLGFPASEFIGDEAADMGDNLPALDLGTGVKATAIAVSYVHGCALLDNGAVKCWGQNSIGSLGLGDTSSRGDDPGEMGDILLAVDFGSVKESPAAIVAGHSHTCAQFGASVVKCWGSNNVGQLGLGDILNRGDAPNEMGDNLPAVSLGAVGGVLSVSTRSQSTCALFMDGTLKCWGVNSNGQLGISSTTNRGDGPNEMGDALPFVPIFEAL